MLTTNQFLRQNSTMDDGNGGSQPVTTEYLYVLRTSYESLSKSLKKAIDSPYVREKNRMTFDKWWNLISYNINEGKKTHAENTQRPVMQSKRTQRMVEDLNSERTKKMLKID